MKISLFSVVLMMILAISTSKAQGQASDKLFGEALEYIVQGDTETAKVKVSVTDCETDEPIAGAHIKLSYDKEVSGPRGSIFQNMGSCSGEAAGSTDEKGKVKLELSVTKCPHAFIGTKEEDMDIGVYALGYERNGKEIKNSHVTICLEKAAWKIASPPIAIEYSKYEIDLERYRDLFNSIKEVNKRAFGERLPVKKSYVVWRYASTGVGHDEGFTEFLEKIESTSDIKSVSLLKEILSKQYPLPYKSVKYTNEESWRADDYVYGLGRRAAARAIMNIADDRLNELLPLAIDVPEPYLAFLKDAGIVLSAEIYWEYLSEKFTSRKGLLPGEGKMRPDPRVLVVSLLKERLPQREYERKMVSFYVLLSKLNRESRGESKDGRSMHDYDSQKYLAMREKVAAELFTMKPPLFAPEVIKVLADMEVNDLTRKYLHYLYEVDEYKAIAEALQGNKKLMRAFLGLDILDQRDNPPRYYYREEEKKSLLAHMPKVAETISNDIEHFIDKEMKRSSGLASWAIQNLAMISRSKADTLATELYQSPQESAAGQNALNDGASQKRIKKHEGSQDRYAKQSVLVGAAEARLPGLCKDIYDELDVTKDLGKDYFSLGYYRIKYLNTSCPSHMQRFVKSFDYRTVNEKSKNKYFEESYEHQVPEAIREFFPKGRGDKLLNDYYGAHEDLIQRIYSGSSYPPRYSVLYLCERFEKDISTMTHYRASSLIDYLDACYPEKKEEHVRFRNTAPESNAWAYVRNYGHFYNLTRQKEDNESHQPVPVYDKRFKDLFFPAAPVSKQTSTSYQSASLPIDSKTAFSIIREALNSPDPLVQQAALYAFRWFSKGRPAELTEKVRGFASSDRFPHYLYAAASLAVVEYNSPVVRSAADRAFGFLDPVIRKRSRAEDTGATAFNALLLMDLCRMSGKIKEYEQLLDFVLQPDTAGRYGYEGFQADLEKSIATSSVGSGTLNRLLDSSRPLDTIVGIRLAALKNYPLATDRLTRYLRHDDSYVRRAAASYVIAHKAQFPDLFSALSNNTNRVVRAMLSNASAP